jgi:hypothetical protein
LTTLEEGVDSSTFSVESITSVPLENWSVVVKVALVKQELVLKWESHHQLVLEWAEDARRLLDGLAMGSTAKAWFLMAQECLEKKGRTTLYCYVFEDNLRNQEPETLDDSNDSLESESNNASEPPNKGQNDEWLDPKILTSLDLG